MDIKEKLLDIYSDGGEWEDFEPIIDQMLSDLAALRAQLSEAREVMKNVIRYDDAPASGVIDHNAIYNKLVKAAAAWLEKYKEAPAP